MFCQQLGGINGVCFYTSSIFDLAGNESVKPSYFLAYHYFAYNLEFPLKACFKTRMNKLHEELRFLFYSGVFVYYVVGFPSTTGSIIYAILQVLILT
jgi:hypothetical protein